MITKKQKAISANITNMNTPGYVRQDIDFGQFLGPAESPLETKLSQKLGPAPLANEKEGEVNPATELIDMSKNAMYYTLATKRVTTTIQELKQIAQIGR